MNYNKNEIQRTDLTADGKTGNPECTLLCGEDVANATITSLSSTLPRFTNGQHFIELLNVIEQLWQIPTPSTDDEFKLKTLILNAILLSEKLENYYELYRIEHIIQSLFGFQLERDYGKTKIFFTDNDFDDLREYTPHRISLHLLFKKMKFNDLKSIALFKALQTNFMHNFEHDACYHMLRVSSENIVMKFYEVLNKAEDVLSGLYYASVSNGLKYGMHHDYDVYYGLTQRTRQKIKHVVNTYFHNMRRAELQIGVDIRHTLTTDSVSCLINTIKQEIGSTCADLYSNLKEVLTEMAIIFLLFYCADKILRQKHSHHIKLLLEALIIVVALICAPTVAGVISAAIKKISTYTHGLKACLQAKMTTEHGILGLLALSTITLLSGKNKWDLDTLTKQISALPRFAAGVDSIYDAVTDIIAVVRKEIFVTYFGFQPQESTELDEELHRFNQLMEQLTLANQNGKLLTSSVLQSSVLEAEMLGLRLLQRRGLNDIRPTLTLQFALLRKIIDRLGLTGNTSKGQRLAPIIIYLYGKTDQGKSSMVTTLATQLLAKICDAEGIDKSQISIGDMIYARNTEQEFWDGYHGQLITVFDDFAQRRDFAQDPNIELFELIRAGNTFPYPLHMATTDAKASTLFQSRIVILTSNARRPKIESLVAPEAVYRRIDVAYQVQFKAQYCEGDAEQQKKIRKLKPEHTTRYDITKQEFIPYDISKETDPQTQELKDLEDVVESAFAKYQSRFLFEQTRLRFDTTTAKDLGFRTELQAFSLQHLFNKVKKIEDTTREIGQIDAQIRSILTEISEHRKETWYEKFNKRTQQIKELFNKHKVLFTALTALAVVLGGSLIYRKFKQIGHSITGKTESAYTPGPRRTAARESAYNPGAKRATTKFHKTTRLAQTEAADNAAIELSSSLLKKNMYFMRCGEHSFGSAIFLVGRVLLFPRHFVTIASTLNHETDRITLQSVNDLKRVSFEMTLSDFLREARNVYEGGERDLAIIDFPTAISHRNIVKHIATEEQQRRMQDVAVSLVGIRETATSLLGASSYAEAIAVERSLPNDRSVPIYDIIDDERIQLTDYWRYHMGTRKGDCGSILLANNNMIPNKILGMHSMGIPSQDDGYATPLYREDIECILSTFTRHSQTEPPEHPIQATLQCSPYKGECEVIGIAPETHITPPTSKIHKSRLHPDVCSDAWCESGKRPALLCTITPREDENIIPNKGPKFDPKLYRLEKVMERAHCVDQELLDLVGDDYIQELKSICMNSRSAYKSASTFEEAIKGIDGDPYINSINRQSAPGYGWKPEPGKPGKTTWFGSDGDFDLNLAAPVRARVEETINLAKQNKRNTQVFIDTLKDELRPKEKFWKTRVFSACSQDYYIACKQYFQGIVGLLTRNRIDTGIAVGINVYSAEWHKMARHLTKFHEKLVAGDFEGFDASLLTQILDKAREVLNALAQLLTDWNPEHDDIRNVLFYDLFNSYHCDGNILYMWTHSLPSGHFLTAIVNSIFVNLVFRYLICLVLKIRKAHLIRKILCKLRMITYGDDHVVALPEEVLHLMNQLTLPDLFRQIGMGYTDETKGTNQVYETRKLMDITFLKRGFRFEDKLSRFVAPLSLDTVLETPFWTRKSASEITITKTNCEWAIAELALHSQEIFDKWTKAIVLATRSALNWVPMVQAERLGYIQQLEEQEHTILDNETEMI